MTRHQPVGRGDPVAGAAPAGAAPVPAAMGARAVERAMMLLSLVGRGGDGGATLAAIVAGGGLSKATTRRLLLALMRGRMVEQDAATRRYRLRPETFVPGQLARRHDMTPLAADYAARPGYSADIIRGDVDRALRDGCALNPGRFVAGSWGIGVPVRHPDGRIACAPSIRGGGRAHGRGACRSAPCSTARWPPSRPGSRRRSAPQFRHRSFSHD